MSILIRGMEMPKPKFADMATVYDAYVLVSPNGHAAIVVENKDGLDSTEFPLVPVPPHGRLIDADALTRKIVEECEKFDAMNQYDSGLRAGYRASTKAIRLAPTIIPAAEEINT